jgi:hypothetical protein
MATCDLDPLVGTHAVRRRHHLLASLTLRRFGGENDPRSRAANQTAWCDFAYHRTTTDPTRRADQAMASREGLREQPHLGQSADRSSLPADDQKLVRNIWVSGCPAPGGEEKGIGRLLFGFSQFRKKRGLVVKRA